MSEDFKDHRSESSFDREGFLTEYRGLILAAATVALFGYLYWRGSELRESEVVWQPLIPVDDSKQAYAGGGELVRNDFSNKAD